MGKSTGFTPATTPKQEAPYEDIEELRSADGIIGIISKHRSNGMLTFTILREFSSYGATKRTGFFSETMTDSYQRMVLLVFEKIERLQKELGPFETRGRQRKDV